MYKMISLLILGTILNELKDICVAYQVYVFDTIQ